MIHAIFSTVPKSATERGQLVMATASVGDQHFSVVSRSSAACALARAMVDAGIADDEIQFTGLGSVSHASSIHKLAEWTYSESARQTVHRVKYRPFGEAGAEPFETGPSAYEEGVI